MREPSGMNMYFAIESQVLLVISMSKSPEYESDRGTLTRPLSSEVQSAGSLQTLTNLPIPSGPKA
jgi:hypothetical protein